MVKKIVSVFSVVALYGVIFVFLFHGIQKNIPTMSQEQEGIPLPVVMYHSILKDESRSGKYVIPPRLLDADIRYLEARGYTTVSAAQLIDYVKNNEPLPEKPVMLTFDDGCYNNLAYAVPILKDHNARGIFSVVGAYTDEYTESDIANASYGYLRWRDVYEMYVSENCEIGNHSYDFHQNNHGRNGSMKRKGEDSDSYQKIFAADTEQMQNECYEHCGFYPKIYTYPYGMYSEESFDILKSMGFEVTFSCVEGINRITRDPDCLYLLKRYNRPAGISSDDFFRKLLKD